MKRWLRNYAVLGAMLLFLLAPALAQQNTAVRGGLAGVVFDETGSVDAECDCRRHRTSGQLCVKTDGTGRYQLVWCGPGRLHYKVVVELPGFK